MSEDTIRQMESRLALMVLQQRIASVHAWGSLVMKALCTDTSVTGELLANPVRASRGAVGVIEQPRHFAEEICW